MDPFLDLTAMDKELLPVPLFLFTMPTHWAAGAAALLLSNMFFQAPELSKETFFLVWFFSMLPDMIDNPQSRPGMVFSGMVRLLTVGKVEIGRYVEHRGFWHSLSALALVSGLAYFIYPDAVGSAILGMGSHIYIDGFQKRGINLFGFGEWRGRVSKKTEIPSGRKEEAYFAAVLVLVILLSSWVASAGGGKDFVCKQLGTLECIIRQLIKCRAEGRFCILYLEKAQKQPGGGSLLSGEFLEPEAIGLAKIIFWKKDKTPYSLGHSADDNYLAGRSGHIIKGPKNKACLFAFQLQNQPLGDLKRIIPASLPHYRISGNALLREQVNVKIFHHRHNTISGKGSQLKLTYASLPDIELYGLENILVESADLELLYYVPEGEQCRWQAPKDHVAGKVEILNFWLERDAKMVVAEGATIPAGGLIALNAGVDDEIRLLERELQAVTSQADRRETERQRKEARFQFQEKPLSDELAKNAATIKRLKGIQRLNPGRLLDELRKSGSPEVSPVDVASSARRISAKFLQQLEKDRKQIANNLERLREAWASELNSYRTAKEQSDLKMQKLSAKHSALSAKREIRTDIGGKVLRIEKTIHDEKMRLKILLLARKAEVGQN